MKVFVIDTDFGRPQAAAQYADGINLIKNIKKSIKTMWSR